MVALAYLWQPLLSLAVHEELAAAEGVRRDLVKGIFVVLLALAIAIIIKVVGILLAIAFLIMPAAAARPLSATPERMAAIAAAIAAFGALAGIQLSVSYDIPGGRRSCWCWRSSPASLIGMAVRKGPVVTGPVHHLIR